MKQKTKVKCPACGVEVSEEDLEDAGGEKICGICAGGEDYPANEGR